MAHNIPREPRAQEDHFNRIRGTRTEAFDPYVDDIVSPATVKSIFH